ncbi:MAG: hypothetical protein AAFY02_20825 [Pseudomonadota bacterium]
MTADPPAPATARMVDYDHHSLMQAQAIRNTAERIRDLVEAVGPAAPAFVVMDYGCGPGHSALDAVSPAVAAYRRLSPEGTLVVRHADQPGNDWGALATLAFGPEGYHKGAAPIRTEFVVGSFYDQLADNGSVALGTCFIASHWLSRVLSLEAPGTVLFADLEGAARRAFEELARSDWTQFLRCRAAELRSGGYLLVSALGSLPDATQPNGARAAGSGIYRALQRVAAEMVGDGLLDAEALTRFVFPLWFPTAAEARAPVDQEPDLAAAFTVIEVETGPTIYNPLDVYADQLGDPKTYARSYRGYIRGFAESTLRLHLFEPSAKNEDQVERLTTAFFDRLEALYRSEPGPHASETLITTLVLQRR